MHKKCRKHEKAYCHKAVCFFVGGIMKKVFKKLFKKLFHKKKDKTWKIYLYLNNQCIKCIKVPTDFRPMEHFYIETLWFKKHLIGTNLPTKMVFKFYKYKYTDNKNKEVHIEVLPFDGMEI